MRFHLREILYHLLWMVGCKKIEVIGQDVIQYQLWPWWMLYGGHKGRVRWGDCQVIVHHATKTIIILMASNLPKLWFRSTLYHEFIEGCCFLGIGVAQNKGSLQKAVLCAYKETDLLDSPLRNRVDQFFKKTGDWPHVTALLLELQLIRRELGEEALGQAVEYALTKRL